MENYIGKICPFCKTAITEADTVKVCPACGIPHHEGCWEENHGCTTFGCSEQHYEAQHTNPTAVCTNCGAPLGDGQAFCPMCGTPKAVAPQKNICSKCGNELKDGQEFCPMCGQKAGLVIDSGVSSAINQFNAGVTQSKSKKKLLFILIGAGAATLALIITLILVIGGGKDFRDMYGQIENESWCYISSDGTYMKIDTNPYDIDDDFNLTAYYKIKSINSDLGFSSSLFDEMGETTALDGRQEESNGEYSVSWKYHPDNGLEVTYKFK